VLVDTLTIAVFIGFLTRLRHDAGQRRDRPVFCIVDNHPMRRAKAVDRSTRHADLSPSGLIQAGNQIPCADAQGISIMLAWVIQTDRQVGPVVGV
jgi:hypothetical protein